MQKARTAAARSDIVNLTNSLNIFEIDCARFPTTAEGLQALMVQPPGVNGWKGPYLEKGVPADPWGNPYQYKCPGQHANVLFDLHSFGPDGREGGGDDIDNWTKK